jgi:SAM-dependent methyltransferase
MTPGDKYDAICRAMEASFPVLASVWSSARSNFGDAWLDEFVGNVETLYGEIGVPIGPAVEDALEGYAEFANDAMRSQVFFEKHGRYPSSSHEDCTADFYHNEDHMNRCYLPGMYLSHLLWPQHFHMLQGYRRGILSRVRNARLFFEVGVGCGMYSKVTLQELPRVRGVGFDISPHSLAFTRRMVGAFGLAERYQTENRDIQRGYDSSCDFLICQEVLEHLDDPGRFCEWLFGLIEPGGSAYITAALNAAHSDHIYLFRDPMEVEELLRAAGLQPVHAQEEFAPGSKPRRITPSLAGFYCEKPA